MSHSKDERDTILEDVYERTYEYEQEYGYCPQVVLAGLQDTFGIVDDSVIQSSHALAGGSARTTNGTCGALVGGIMAIGAVFGRHPDEFGKSSKEGPPQSAVLAKDLQDRFVEEYGSILCREIQEELFGRSYDLWDPEEYEAFNEAGAHEDKCPAVTGTAARMTADILLDAGVEPSE